VYKLSQTGQETVLHTFEGKGCPDWANPAGNIVLEDGDLYGVTLFGGADNEGVVYRLTPSGQETTLYSFTGGADAGDPNGLAVDSAGNFYGTTPSGGDGWGVVFKLDRAGNLNVLHTFTGGTDGALPPAWAVGSSSRSTAREPSACYMLSRRRLRATTRIT